ncbi:MAG: YgeY family selenium metabolism-linked hydrolase [Thermovirgaceae bacterium]|nr:YgeY family selenium metabolism-linked hydrolase [Thermovirgaceae bacterium]
MLDTIRERELVRLCQEFVRVPSPSGNERQMAGFVRDAMLSLGFDRADIDSYGSVAGSITFDEDGPTLLFEAQMDHVDVADPFEWEFYPFGGILKNGRIYGRGSTDQKGSLAAMACAASFLKEDRPQGCGGKIVVAATVHQERMEGASSRLVDGNHRPDYVVTGEASALRIERGQRGRAEIILETLGKTAHSAHPDFGINAAGHMVTLVSIINKRFSPVSDPFLGKGILELTNLVSSPEKATGVVPAKCRAIFDRRLILGETREGVLGQIEEIIQTAAALIPGLKASARIAPAEEMCYTGVRINGDHFVPGWLFEREDPFVERCLEGLQNAGLPALMADSAGFGTNGCYYGGVKKLPTVAFGPSFQDLAHITDEYIEVDQLIQGCRGYYGIARSILSDR